MEESSDLHYCSLNKTWVINFSIVSPPLMHAHTHSLSLVTELLLFDNLLERIPSTLFDMKSLEMLNLDKNHIIELPSTVSIMWSTLSLSLTSGWLLLV